MGLAMPSPIIIGSTYYLVIRTPTDVKDKAKGQKASLPVGSDICAVTIGDHAKISLATKDCCEAKRRFTTAAAALERFWQSLREPPKFLDQKELVAIAGEVRKVFNEAFDRNPGQPGQWAEARVTNDAAKSGTLSGLTIPSPDQRNRDIESRFGGLLDAVCLKHGLIIPPTQRLRALSHVAVAMDEVADVNLRKSLGDYSPDDGAQKYPALEKRQEDRNDMNAITFEMVVDEEVRKRSLGQSEVPLRRSTERKFRAAAKEFAAFRSSGTVHDVTARQAEQWKEDLLAEGALSNNTIRQRIQNLKTIVQWAREHALGDLFPNGNPLDIVKLPKALSVSSSERSYTMEEARMVLLAARREEAPELRWLPWMCAYTGARISEVAQLTKADFFQVEGDWFFRLSTAGGKTLKTVSSARRVPIHPALVEEGLIQFVQQASGSGRLFPPRSQANLSEWIRERLGVSREELAPNHGWRHLFEDRCMVGSVLDTAKRYITGRSDKSSDTMYGKSEAMLPGLASEMRKYPRFQLD